jgi:hypothetical protein
MNDLPQFFYPNLMGRIMLASLEEVIGRNGINAVLNLAGRPELIGNYPPADLERGFSFETVSALQSMLEQAYGPRGGRGLALRAGRVCFKYGMREFGPMMGLTETAFRLLPLNAKLKTGGQAFADLFNRLTDQRVRLEDAGPKLLWHIERCPLCWGRHTGEPSCHMAVGLLQECLYWVSGGKIFNVEETQCVAEGDPVCTIEIDKTPVA